MAALTLTGASGNTYNFATYSIDTSFENFGAIYVFARQYYDNQQKSWYELLYIGKTSELGDRINGHEKWGCVNQHRGNSICVYAESNANSRTRIENDLLANYTTPCNG